MNKVSVIIPNYNRATIIGETIKNMLAQTLPPHEVIVVDDGSSDNSIEVIKSFGNKIKLVQQVNKGPGAARNAGIKLATGEFIQFMDSDDLASLNKLEVQSKALVVNNADIVYGPWLKAWMDDKTMRLKNVVLQQDALPVKRSPLLWFLTNWSMVFQQCLIRRSIFDDIGGYREDIRFFEDGDLFVRMLVADKKLIFESETLTFYRLNDFGKLTGEGLISVDRSLAQATFYQDVIKLANSNKSLAAYMGHPEFKANVQNAINDLNKSNSLNKDQHRELIEVSDSAAPGKTPAALIKKLSAGLSQRLKGHRWPGSYKAGALSKNQKQLIIQMGYNLIN